VSIDYDNEEDGNQYEERDTENKDARGPSYDGLAIYRREINRVPLLTRQEEIDLAAKVKQGDEAARTRMIEANLRLVVDIAEKGYAKSTLLPDLISEGNIGLMKAVDTFDQSKGCRLSTHATWWIKKAISRAWREHDRVVRLPSHIIDQLGRMKRVSRELTVKLDRKPTDPELADAMGMSRVKFERLCALEPKPVSLDAPIGDDDDDDDDTTTLGDALEDTLTPTSCDSAGRREVRDRIVAALSRLTPRERKVVELYYGLNGDPAELNCTEVATRLGVTTQCVSERHKRALEKLRGFLAGTLAEETA
jgi:RNA polymerase primary sigma factor